MNSTVGRLLDDAARNLAASADLVEARLEAQILFGHAMGVFNAAVREEGTMTYSQFINKLSVKGIDLNRKVLADLAMNEPETFKKLIDSVK